MDSHVHDPLRTLKQAGVVPRSVLRQVSRGGPAVRSSSQRVPSRAGTPARTLSRSTAGSPSSPVRREQSTVNPEPSGSSDGSSAGSWTTKFLQLVQRSGDALVDASDAPGPVLGIIESQTARGNLVVAVWRRGDVVPTVSQKREKVTFHPSQLLKLTPAEFDSACRRPFMRAANYELLLVSNGYDATAPVSLMAYNNRLIASLMQRIDTSVHTKPDPTLRNRVMKNRKPPPGKVKQSEPPKTVPVLDPLADVRDELRALADFSSTAPQPASPAGGAGQPNPGSPASSPRRAGQTGQSKTADDDRHHHHRALTDAHALRDTTSVSRLFRPPSSAGHHHPAHAAGSHTPPNVLNGSASPAFAGPSMTSFAIPDMPPQHSTASAGGGGGGLMMSVNSEESGVRQPAPLSLLTPEATAPQDAHSVIEDLAASEAAATQHRVDTRVGTACGTLMEAERGLVPHLPAKFYTSSTTLEGSTSQNLAASTKPSAASIRVQRSGVAAGSAGRSMRRATRGPTDSAAEGLPPIVGSIERVLDNRGHFLFRAKSPPELSGTSFVARLHRAQLFVASEAQRDELHEAAAALAHGAGDSSGDDDGPPAAGRGPSSHNHHHHGDPSLFMANSTSEPVDGAEALLRLRGQALTFRAIRPDPSLCAVAEVFFPSGDSLAEELVRCGLAQAVFSAFDDASVLFPNEVAAKLDCLGGARSDVLKLKAAQDRAQSQRIGLWSLRGAEANFLEMPSSRSPSQHQPPPGTTPVSRSLASGGGKRGGSPPQFSATVRGTSPQQLDLERSAGHYSGSVRGGGPTGLPAAASTGLPKPLQEEDLEAPPAMVDEATNADNVSLFTAFEASAAFHASVKAAVLRDSDR